MSRARNPFTPTFGVVPQFLAGRDALLDNMNRAFEDGPGDPNLCTLLIGPRGSGRTALLSCIGDEAREHGWIDTDVMAEPGMLEEILQHAEAEASQVISEPSRKHLVGVNVGEVLGLEWETEQGEPSTWRMRMEALLSKLESANSGLLITVDEVRVSVEEMVRLASAYELFIRANHSVSLVMAGLPSHVTDLVEDERVSFLRRARQQRLTLLGDADVARALRKTVERAGKEIDGDALDIAVKSSQGFPYMLQLVGYHTWEESDKPVIDARDAQRGAKAAEADFREGVLERTWHEMSAGNQAFARAMLPDANGSTLTSVAERLGRKTNYTSTFKRRLLQQGIIGERPGNRFDFGIPLMREFFAEQNVG